MLAITPSSRTAEPGGEVLRVLDAEAAVARAVFFRDALEDIEQRADSRGRRWRAR